MANEVDIFATEFPRCSEDKKCMMLSDSYFMFHIMHCERMGSNGSGSCSDQP